MKIERESPAVKAEKDSMPNGFIQDREKSREPATSPDLAIAMAAKITMTVSWRPTRAYWTHLVAVMPR
ncbi:UNVERIFIED_CONTAM: hypothetical protein RKD43_002895 [Streptomyces graminofaciens]